MVKQDNLDRMMGMRRTEDEGLAFRLTKGKTYQILRQRIIHISRSLNNLGPLVSTDIYQRLIVSRKKKRRTKC